MVNPTIAALVRRWEFPPKACCLHGPGLARGGYEKTKRSVRYLKVNDLARHRYDIWGQMESHLERWTGEFAEGHIPVTTGEQPLVGFRG